MEPHPTLDLLLKLRRAEPFRPFLIRHKDGREITVVRRMGFAANETQGSAHGNGGSLRFKLDDVKVIPLVPAENVA